MRTPAPDPPADPCPFDYTATISFKSDTLTTVDLDHKITGKSGKACGEPSFMFENLETGETTDWSRNVHKVWKN